MNESKSSTRIVLGIFAVITSIWLVAPMFAVVPISFAENASFQFPPQGFSTRWYESFFRDPSWLRALGNSVLIGLLAAIVAVPLGTIAALAINRSTSRLASLAGYDRSLELAAASLGANPLRTFFTVTVPLIAPGVAAGAVFAFVTSFDEVIVSQFMVSPALQTLPIAMYASVTRSTDPTIAAVATLILVSVLIGFCFYRFVVVPLSQRRGAKA